MGLIIFNGVSSKDLNVVVEHPPKYIAPEVEYEVVHVPGRNGDVIIRDKRKTYNNVPREYELAVDATDYYFPNSVKYDYTEKVKRVIQWLNSANGYARLEDTYEPDVYRMAYYQEELSVENLFMQAGRATVSFTCMPQRFYKSGEIPVEVSGKTIPFYNPTTEVALPVMKVYGSSGTVKVGENILTFDSIDSYVTIDSLNSKVHKDGVNYGDKVVFSADFPEFEAGENYIYTTGSIDKIVITPNWWTP